MIKDRNKIKAVLAQATLCIGMGVMVATTPNKDLVERPLAVISDEKKQEYECKIARYNQKVSLEACKKAKVVFDRYASSETKKLKGNIIKLVNQEDYINCIGKDKRDLVNKSVGDKVDSSTGMELIVTTEMVENGLLEQAIKKVNDYVATHKVI